MTIFLILYLIGISKVLAFALFILFFFVIFIFLSTCIPEFNHHHLSKVKLICVSFILLITCALIPKEKTLYAMLAIKCEERSRLGIEVPKEVTSLIKSNLDD